MLSYGSRLGWQHAKPLDRSIGLHLGTAIRLIPSWRHVNVARYHSLACGNAAEEIHMTCRVHLGKLDPRAKVVCRSLP